jgi:hypothetical protein
MEQVDFKGTAKAFMLLRQKRLSPRRASKQSLLHHSPKRTQVRLESLLQHVSLRQMCFESTGGPGARVPFTA